LLEVPGFSLKKCDLGRENGFAYHGKEVCAHPGRVSY
jgi:hypothetical protein